MPCASEGKRSKQRRSFCLYWALRTCSKHSFHQVEPRATNGNRSLAYSYSLDHQSIVLFALYCSVTYFLVTFQGFFCALLYCFLNSEVILWARSDDKRENECCLLSKVRVTLARRIRTTRLWSHWKQYFGTKNQCKRNGTTQCEDRTRLESLLPQSTPVSVRVSPSARRDLNFRTFRRNKTNSNWLIAD